MTRETNRVQLLCSKCGSSNVTRDAEASWDVNTQGWDLAVVQDQAFCGECEGETTLRELELPDE